MERKRGRGKSEGPVLSRWRGGDIPKCVCLKVGPREGWAAAPEWGAEADSEGGRERRHYGTG